MFLNGFAIFLSYTAMRIKINPPTLVKKLNFQLLLLEVRHQKWAVWQNSFDTKLRIENYLEILWNLISWKKLKIKTITTSTCQRKISSKNDVNISWKRNICAFIYIYNPSIMASHSYLSLLLPIRKNVLKCQYCICNCRSWFLYISLFVLIKYK